MEFKAKIRILENSNELIDSIAYAIVSTDRCKPPLGHSVHLVLRELIKKIIVKETIILE